MRDGTENIPLHFGHFGDIQQLVNNERAIRDSVGDHGQVTIPTTVSATSDSRTTSTTRRVLQQPTDSALNNKTPACFHNHTRSMEIGIVLNTATAPTATMQPKKWKWKCSTSHYEWNELPWKNYIKASDLFFPMRKQGCAVGEEVILLLEKKYKFPREDLKQKIEYLIISRAVLNKETSGSRSNTTRSSFPQTKTCGSCYS